MSTNPYAPPRAVDTPITSLDGIPALWNPNAAANWSLLFSPVFGAVLHMKNWQALGESEKASRSKAWAIGSLLFLVGVTVVAALLPDSAGLNTATRASGLALLVTWYVQGAKAQIVYVKERYGKTYPRKGWALPLGVAMLCIGAFIIAIFAIAVVFVIFTGGA